MLKVDHGYQFRTMKIRIALPETIVSAMKIQTVQDTVEVAIVTAMVSYIYKYLKEYQKQIPTKIQPFQTKYSHSITINILMRDNCH